MSYESKMLKDLSMPVRTDVEEALIKILFKHNGTIKEFNSSEPIVAELATYFGLNEAQKTAFLETIYQKENRIKRVGLWHRLLFRAADSLTKQSLVSNPSTTFQLTNKREWMLTESGYDKALSLLNIPIHQKDILPIKSYEVQQEVNKIVQLNDRPIDYNPFGEEKATVSITKEAKIRQRGFRQAVIESYDYKCAYCGLKIQAPNSSSWEIQAAHIVPHRLNGKDEIFNGIALCHLHHWAFDVGWFTLFDDFHIQLSSKIKTLSSDMGLFNGMNFLLDSSEKKQILLPSNALLYPHPKSISWHRENVFMHKVQ